MGQILLLSDLDNTLLFSHRHKQPGDVCVEWLEGRVQGFMTPWVWETLGVLPANLRLVPVTTRSLAQYRRIQWPKAPELAAVANGGSLLRRGEADRIWQMKFTMQAEACREAFQQLEHSLSQQDWCLRYQMVDGVYSFAVCREEAGLAARAAEFPVPAPLTAALAGRKLYFFPPGLHKGAAAAALREALSPALLVCAGDSPLDLPMLALADRALVPEAPLAANLSPERTEICPAGERFSEFVLRRTLAWAAAQ